MNNEWHAVVTVAVADDGVCTVVCDLGPEEIDQSD